MIRNLSSTLSLSAVCLDRQFGRGWAVQGFCRQRSGSGQPSVKPISGDRVHGYRVQNDPVQDDSVPTRRVPSSRTNDGEISASQIRTDRSFYRNWFIDLPHLGQFLSIQDRWFQSGRYGMTVP